MEVRKPIISPKETKEYLACNEIPQLFEVNSNLLNAMEISAL